ncbi:MAG TPA: peptide ABC transporter substrate-binding protein [Pyrinomonadaceae bacterium]|nr:peptide ABC transporter substrate-binding protein [Pyrinomonadaceae bacterium]
MPKNYLRRVVSFLLLGSFVLASISCSPLATKGDFFGRTVPPDRNILRYVNGGEPESFDPAISSGQPEARIYMALYEGLVEYDPKSLNAIPAIAESWDVNSDSSEFVFHLRKNARWSNGDPINAQDFVYSIRRAANPATLSRTASLAYYIKYAQAFNSGQVFVRDPKDGSFLLEKDFAPDGAKPAESVSQQPLTSSEKLLNLFPGPDPDSGTTTAPDTAFHQFMHSPARVTLPSAQAKRDKALAANPKLKEAVADKEFVKITGEDIGVEAVDDYTVRISLAQPAPYFTGVLAHQLFRLVPRKVIERFGAQWTDPANIVTCGPFKLKAWKPYDEVVVERDPMYWDAANVHLDEIHFFVSVDHPTSMNLYRVGSADAVLNHSVPNAWLDVVRPKKDYMDAAEAAITYLLINVTQPPMNDLRVRRAFNMAIDKVTYSKHKRTTKPLSAFTPEGIFVGYPQPKGEGFDPDLARKLLGEAGYPVTKNSDGSYSCEKFPIDQVQFFFNTHSSNKALAEFMQAQWKQNLGITVPLNSMESKTFMSARSKLEYKGFALGIWGADYMDPLTFLTIFLTPGGDNGSGWWDQKYVDLLEEANHTLDQQKRYELLARAEKYMLDAQPTIPLETPSVNWVKKPYVKGLYPNPSSLFAWKYVYIERDPARWDYATPSLTD